MYGLAWGVKHRLLDAREYASSIERGWSALQRAVDAEGRVGWVQQVSDRPESVSEADTQFYGVGAFLLAALRGFVTAAPLVPGGPALPAGVTVLGADNVIRAATREAVNWGEQPSFSNRT